jgi:very-short-patch-repair endonuclease
MTRKGSVETSIEKAVREELQKREVAFEQEYKVRPRKNSRWSYYLDFFLPTSNCAIEVDGQYWHSSLSAKRIDEKKDKRMLQKGIFVVRLSEEEITKDVAKAVQRALDEINNRGKK